MRLRIVPHIEKGCTCFSVVGCEIVVVAYRGDGHGGHQTSAYCGVEYVPFCRRGPACIAWEAAADTCAVAVVGVGGIGVGGTSGDRVARCNRQCHLEKGLDQQGAGDHDGTI